MPKKKAHQFPEAFYLMRYECQDCGHHEMLWNARDGVTPFGCECPACGGQNMLHTDWHEDEYAPDHCPEPGQGVWIDTPPQLIPVMVRLALHLYREETGEDPPAGLVKALEKQYEPGTPYLLRFELY